MKESNLDKAMRLAAESLKENKSSSKVIVKTPPTETKKHVV